MCILKNNQKKKKERKRNKVSEQCKPHKNTHGYTENRVVITKRKEVEGKMKWIKMIHCIVADWKYIFGDEHTVGSTEVEMQCCTHET